MASAGGSGGVAAQCAGNQGNVEMAAPFRRDWREADVTTSVPPVRADKESAKHEAPPVLGAWALDRLQIPQRNTVSFLQLNSNQRHGLVSMNCVIGRKDALVFFR